MAARVQSGDRFICYTVRMICWIGVFDIIEGSFIERTPIFVTEDDPYIVRFRVRPSVWLPLEKTIPIQDEKVFSHLSFTRNVKQGGYWLGPLRRSLQKIDTKDGEFLSSLLSRQNHEQKPYDVNREQYERELNRRIQRSEGSVVVTVPDDESDTEEKMPQPTADRESI